MPFGREKRMSVRVGMATAAVLGLLASGAASAQSAAVVGKPEDGARKNTNCIGCHGIPEYKASFPLVYRVPKIAGQNEAYLASALAAYKSGERYHPTMKAIAASLTEQDMADLAAYYSRAAQ